MPNGTPRDVQTRKSRKSVRRELSPSIEKREQRGRPSARAKDHVASEKPRKQSRSRSRRAKDPVASRKRRELSRSRNQRAKDPVASDKRRELSRSRNRRAKDPVASDKRRELSRSRSRRSKGRLARSDKKEKKPTIESNLPRLLREREGVWRDGRGHSSRHHKEETSARAADHELPQLSPLGDNILDMLMRQVSRDECVDICWYVVNNKNLTEAPSFSPRSIFHTRPRTQPVKEVPTRSTARASDYKRPRTQPVQELSSTSDYSSGESEADRGETCEKPETAKAESAELGASAKAGASIKPLRVREKLREVSKQKEALRNRLLELR
jgi:hypothetical protein